MPRLTAITVRAASRQPVGANGFQEASVSLAFAVADDDPALEGLADHVSAELEAAFIRLWARLEGNPEEGARTRSAVPNSGTASGGRRREPAR